MSIRPVKDIIIPQQVREGGGVLLNRVFGHGTTKETDPFLMLDHFESNDPATYMAGFPWHPHRGIETISYILAGGMEHEDSLGNKGLLGPGDVQWMTAGSGIIHQEMPQKSPGGQIHGFQLWANLPAAKKMTAPRYQDIQAQDIPEIVDDDGTKVRVITGEFWGQRGPVEGIAADPRYLDFWVPANTRRTIKVSLNHHAFAYVFDGTGEFRAASTPIPAPTEYMDENGSTETVPAHPVENRNLVFFDLGDEIVLQTKDEPMRFLLISGQPLREPVAWHGPIVMNTQQELITAFQEYQDGTFLKT